MFTIGANADLQEAVEADLAHASDRAAFEVFTECHTESGRDGRVRRTHGCQVYTGESGVCGEMKQEILTLISNGELQLGFIRLADILNLTADKAGGKLRHDAVERQGVVWYRGRVRSGRRHGDCIIPRSDRLARTSLRGPLCGARL